MTTRRTVLNVEQLGARVLPSTTVAVPSTTSTVPAVQSTAQATTWSGAGRFTITSAASSAKTYTFQGSADFGSSGFFAIAGSITTVGSKSGQATGKITLSDPRGTLTLALTGPTQTANSGLPASLNYKVVSGTGFFAHYSGTGTYKVAASLFLGDDDRGNFAVTSTMPKVTSTLPPPPTKPPTVTTITGPSWTGQGRYTIAAAKGSTANTYTFQGTADFGSSGFFAVGGTIQAVGDKSGQATGKIILSDPRGTLTLEVTGPTQSAKSALPAKFTYKVVSGTGFFSHYAGTGTVQLVASLFSGYDDKGHFDVAVKPNS